MSDRKLPKLTNPDEVLTEAEWDYYFECRKKYDHPVSDAEGLEIVKKLNRLDVFNPVEKEEITRLTRQIPVVPALALAIKKVQGMKELFRYNLYEAKKAYPDEF